ncbi:MAG: hypothetical protein M1269_06805 [Chloroflexi bacterium]|nr:hypothetical protein [Chloroflexota bacterium]
MADDREIQALKDDQDLRYLSIFYYIFGALTAIFGSLFIIHIIIGAFLMLSPEAGKSQGVPSPLIGLPFVIIGSIVVISGWAFAIVQAMTGKYLKERKNHIFCMIVSAIECMMFPFGTVLGVFTIITLNRASVKELFNRDLKVSADSSNAGINNMQEAAVERPLVDEVYYVNLLSLFHYIVAALITVQVSINAVMFNVMARGMFEEFFTAGTKDAEVQQFMEFIMNIQRVFIGLFIAAGIILAILLILGGYFLKKRKNYNFCFVIAILSCLFMPLGTILGVFTIIFLTRKTVKAMFEVKPGT